MARENILVMDIMTLFLQALGIVSSLLLLYLSHKVKLVRSPNLHLTFALIWSDFLHSVTSIPYTVYLTVHWRPDYFTMDPLAVMVTAIPLPFQLKVNLVIITAVAIDRILAIFYPAFYRMKNHKFYTIETLALAVAGGIFDVGLAFATCPFTERPNCSTFGCFASTQFKYYWGASNAGMGFLVVILIILIVYKLEILSTESQFMGTTKKEKVRFRKANKSALCTLICSLFCITVPAMAAGISDLAGSTWLTFLTAGPFYVLGLLAAGCCHSVTQLILNKELIFKYSAPVTSITPTMIVRSEILRS